MTPREPHILEGLTPPAHYQGMVTGEHNGSVLGDSVSHAGIMAVMSLAALEAGKANRPKAQTPRQIHAAKPIIPPARRNDRCPCGSGQKFKRCCMRGGK